MTVRRVILFLLVLASPCRAEPLAPTLADAFALIAAKPKVDLTHAFSANTPVSPRFGQARMTPAVDPQTLEAYTIAHDGFRATYYAMAGAYGTHVDPPATSAALGATMDEIPLGDMVLPLVVLDDTPYLRADPAHAFSVDDLLAWEKLHGRVPQGSFVALRTDMAQDWTRDPDRFKRNPFPGWSLDTLKMLIEQRGVTAIGHESLATDTTKDMAGAHYLFGSGHYLIAALDNLDKVPQTGAYIVATWPKVKSGLAFPARVFAVLP